MDARERPYKTGILITVDPGQDTGWARWDCGILTNCGLIHPDQFVKAPYIAGIQCINPMSTGIYVVIEDQHILRQSQQKADPNKILKLAHKAGSIAMAFQQFYDLLYDATIDIRFIKVATWKHSRTKEICHSHMLPKLGYGERHILDSSIEELSELKQLDVKDAVSLGLWALGRAI